MSPQPLKQPSSFSSSQINFGAGGNAIALIDTLQRNAIQGIGSCYGGEIRSRVARGWVKKILNKKNAANTRRRLILVENPFLRRIPSLVGGVTSQHHWTSSACQINLSQYLALYITVLWPAANRFPASDPEKVGSKTRWKCWETGTLKTCIATKENSSTFSWTQNYAGLNIWCKYHVITQTQHQHTPKI